MKNLGKKFLSLVLVLAFCLTLWGGPKPVFAANDTDLVEKDWFLAVFYEAEGKTDEERFCLDVYQKG